MNYPYECPDNHTFEVVKSVKDIELPENCPTCGKLGKRYIAKTHFYGASDWDKQEFNPGLGIVTKNSKHRAREAKARGLIEVGNEDMQKTVTNLEREREKRLDEASEKNLEPLVHGLKEELRKAR